MFVLIGIEFWLIKELIFLITGFIHRPKQGPIVTEK